MDLPVEREEYPGVVNLDIEVGEADLIIGAIAVSAVDVGLLCEPARIVRVRGVQLLHLLDG